MSTIFKKIFGGLLCGLLIFSGIFAASAQRTKTVAPRTGNDFKNLAGAAEEFDAMRLPDPSTLGNRSKSTMFAVDAGEQFREFEIPVDSTDNFKLMLLSPNGQSLNLKVALPNDDFFDPRSAGYGRDVTTTESTYGLDGNQFPAEVFTFGLLKTGVVRVRLELPKERTRRGGTIGYLVASSDSPYRLYSYLNTFRTTVGHEIGIFANLFNYKESGETGRPEALIGNIRDSRVLIHTPTGETLEYSMNDTGSGAYGVNFVPVAAGAYTAQVISKGLTPDGAEFIRSAEHYFEVAAATARFGPTARTTPVDELRFRVELPVTGLSSGEKVIAHAEIWGRDADGNEFPVSWLGGMSLTENLSKREITVPLTLDSRWLVQTNPAKSYVLRNVRLQNPDSGVVVGESEMIALPNVRPSETAKSFTGTITDEMRQGVKPTKIGADAVGGKLMLVHGYCSSDVWGSAAQFTNYVKFLDLNQNRSHDQFANLIKNFGASLPSYGIVAHSQGGAASLHLYTYYWSGLDSATGTRLIQSVGTPYQGTALAGNLAILGQIFGAGCGSNNDLTYGGAASWLANIPAWARAKVYFHTTSFTDVWYRYDYCNIATDPFLSDPDDGVVEKAYAQLSGANNLGHKTGWCHTSGMRDPAQTTDSSRNSNMNANAAR